MITDIKKILSVNETGIPNYMKAMPYWVNWKPVIVDGKGRKVPTIGTSPLRGKFWDNDGRLFNDALRTMPKNGGMGLLLSMANEIACIDIDDADTSDDRVEKIIELVPHTWCEYSPSGHGLHIWGYLPNKQDYLLPGRTTIGYRGDKYEWYGSGRFITVTGHTVCCGDHLVDLTKAVRFCDLLRPVVLKPTVEHKHFTRNYAPLTVGIDAILQKAFNKECELHRMYYRGHSWDDKSKEDFYFCQRMWFWLGGHGVSAIENVFRHSALFRPSKGPHYVTLTVANAGKRWNGIYYGGIF